MIYIYTVIYLLFFLIGITFGSFFTLAVYRLPLKQDITHTRSYCPNCNHRLEILDLIPVLSYIFLNGKCRYCKKPIRIRYLLLELLAGSVFLVIGISMGLEMFFDKIKLLYTVVLLLNISGLFILVGINKEKKFLQLNILIYLFIINFLYILFCNFNMYKFIFCSLFLVVISLFNKKNNKILNLISLILYALSFYEINVIFSTILLCFFLQLIVLLYRKIKKKVLFPIESIFLISLIISKLIFCFII